MAWAEGGDLEEDGDVWSTPPQGAPPIPSLVQNPEEKGEGVGI